MTFHGGQLVRITFGEDTIRGVIVLASSNNASLMLGFDGILGEGPGAYLGAMPVMRDDEGVYRDLWLGSQVIIEPEPLQ